MSVDDDEYADLLHELGDELERFLAQTDNSDEMVEFLRDAVGNAPAEVAAIILGRYVVGDWDLTEQQLARIWLIGRRMGYSVWQLLPRCTLALAAPGRSTRPPDPPELAGAPLLAGGSHGPGRGRPGKREFPPTWSDDDVIARTMDVARQPSGTVELPSGDFRAHGERNGVSMSVLVSPQGEVLTSYPVAGDGLVQNPLDAKRAYEIRYLQELLDTLPAGDGEPRRSLEELMAVGEWPQVVRSLRAMGLPWTEQQIDTLDDLADMTGLPLDL